MTRSVLLVEDDPDIRLLLDVFLKAEGLEVLTAKDGAEALEILSKEPPPDVIVFDLMMPRMNGWEFRNRQRRMKSLADIPVVLISGVRGLDYTVQELAPDAVLSKPIDPDELADEIRRL